MADIFLYPGHATPEDVVLSDPTAIRENTGTVAAALPVTAAAATGALEFTASVDATLPVTQAEAVGALIFIGDVTVVLPVTQAEATGQSGDSTVTGDGSAELPVTQANGNGAAAVRSSGGGGGRPWVPIKRKEQPKFVPIRPDLPAEPISGYARAAFAVTTVSGEGGMQPAAISGFASAVTPAPRMQAFGVWSPVPSVVGQAVVAGPGPGAIGRGVNDRSRWNNIESDERLIEELLLMEAA